MGARQRIGFAAAALLLGVGLAAVLLYGSSPRASAQTDCEDAFGQFDVLTTADFNEAINCFNQATEDIGFNITLLADIEADTLAGPSVFTEITQPAQYDLFIEGAGHTLSRGPGAGTTPADVLSFSAASEVNFIGVDLGIEVGPHDTVGLNAKGPASLRMWYMSVTADAAGPSATGVITNGDGTEITVTNTMIDGLPVGMVVDSGIVTLFDTTIAASTKAFDVEGSAFSIIGNTTLDGPIGIELGNGSFFVQSSTITGDGAAIDANSDSVVWYTSSIVQSCSAPVIQLDDVTNQSPATLNAGNNVGGCFTPGQTVETALADNGCARPTPAGCPRTVAIAADSVARDAGDCTDVRAGEIAFDQRGIPRQPVGVGCDAGAVEYADCRVGGPVGMSAGTAAAFNAAIACFNTGAAGPGDYVISLTDDIVATSTGFAEARFATIEQPRDDVSLLVDGNGFSMRNSGDPASYLFGTGFDNRAQITIDNVDFDSSVRNQRSILNQGTGGVTVRNSAFGNNESSLPILAIESTNGVLIIENSSVVGQDVGLRMTGDGGITEPFFGAHGSSFDGATGIQVIAASMFNISNSTFGSDDGLHVLSTSGAVLGIIQNSTFANTGITISNGDLSNISLTSNLIAGTCSGPVIDDGANVGGCFGDPITLPAPSRFNGCFVPVPGGCVASIALDAASPGLGAGDCAFVDDDQRGVQRTPTGPGCDAGAYEAGDLDPVTVQCEAGGSQDFFVTNSNDLDAAIACFNAGTPGPGRYTITLDADIGIDYKVPAITEIDQQTAGHSLEIDGQGFAVLLFESAGLGGADPEAVFVTTDTNVSPVTLTRVTVDHANGSAPSQLISHHGAGPLTVSHSAIGTTSGVEYAILSTSQVDLTIENTMLGGSAGVLAEAGSGQITVTDSYFAANPAGPGIGLSVGLHVDDGRQAAVTNSTFDSDFGILAGDTATVIAANSTFVNSATAGTAAGVTLRSSIANDCAGTPIDGGNNVGGCFGDPIALPASAANECFVPTAAGCTPTVAIPAGSGAIGAGSCTDIESDQRGFPRTPQGAGCDAGAFEAPGGSGDVNGSGNLDASDAQAILDYLAKGEIPNDLAAGDVNGDGEVKLDDALAIAQQVFG